MNCYGVRTNHNSREPMPLPSSLLVSGLEYVIITIRTNAIAIVIAVLDLSLRLSIETQLILLVADTESFENSSPVMQKITSICHSTQPLWYCCAVWKSSDGEIKLMVLKRLVF